MKRTLLLLLSGIAGGSVATYAFVRTPVPRVVPVLEVTEPGGAAAAASTAPEARPLGLDEALRGTIGTAERTVVYRLAMQSDRTALQSLIRQVAGMPSAEGPRFALEALLGRLAELDPRGAAGLAERLGLPIDLVALVYRTWATADAAAALDALGEIEQAADAEVIAARIVEVFGSDELAIARVAGASSRIDWDRLRAETISARAQADPGAALDEAFRLPRALQTAAFDRIADVWVRDDVAAALTALDGVAGLAADSFRAALLRAWARLEPTAALGYFAGLDSVDQMTLLTNGAAQIFMLVDANVALDYARQVTGEAGRMAQSAALQNLAFSDPDTALRRIDQLPPGIERSQLTTAVASAYARQDPDAALAWAQNLQPPQPGVLMNVLMFLARANPDRALEVAMSMQSTPITPGGLPSTFLASQVIASAPDPARMADRVLAMPDTPARDQTLSSIATTWGSRDPEAALRWLLANDRMTEETIMQIGRQFGASNPAAAVSYASQIPSELRASWIGTVAAGYAMSDPQAAMSWVAQYRGQPGYESAVAAVAQAASQYQPAAAARLLDTIDAAPPEVRGAVTQIAFGWAQQDARAAAQWAADLRNVDARRDAVSAVARTWSSSDAPGARAWALSLPHGDSRDAALTPVLTTRAASGEPIDQVLINAFSSDQVRQQAVMQAVSAVASRGDATAARRLADDYVLDPALRAQTEQMIEMIQNQANRGWVSGTRYFNAPVTTMPLDPFTGIRVQSSGPVVPATPAPVQQRR